MWSYGALHGQVECWEIYTGVEPDVVNTWQNSNVNINT